LLASVVKNPAEASAISDHPAAVRAALAED